MIAALIAAVVVAAVLAVVLLSTLGRARQLAEAAAQARQGADAAGERAEAEAAARAEVAEAAAEGARAELASVREATVAGPGHDPASSGLWVLEALRTERRWRESVAPGAAGSPFDGHVDPVAAAVRVAVDAVREESGTSFELVWQVEGPLAPAEALVLGRVADELLAVAAVAADGGELAVSGRPGDLRLVLRTDPALVVPGELAAALAVLGAVEAGPDGVAVSLVAAPSQGSPAQGSSPPPPPPPGR